MTTDITTSQAIVETVHVMNKAEFEGAIAELVARYKDMAVTDKAEAKRDRAEANRILRRIDDERKRVKREYEAPYKAFENELKAIIQPLKDTIELIDVQIKGIEDAERAQRKRAIEAMYAELPTQMPLSAIWHDSWLNLSKSMASVKDEIMSELLSAQQYKAPAERSDGAAPQVSVSHNAVGVPVYDFTGATSTRTFTITATTEQFYNIEEYLNTLGIFYLEE